MLTGRQQEIWDFLVGYVEQHGYPPTVREIGDAVGLASPSTVHAHLAQLERAGLLRRDPTKPRALELADRRRESAESPPDIHRLPLVGEEFVLRVNGDSMIDAGLFDGDFVVVLRQQDARDGDIVVALAGKDE